MVKGASQATDSSLVPNSNGALALRAPAGAGRRGPLRTLAAIVCLSVLTVGVGSGAGAQVPAAHAAGPDPATLGSLAGRTLAQPVVGMAATTGVGYWLVARDGGIFAFGDAAFHGSTGAIRLNRPIVGMAATPSAKGYWLVASDGGIFSFGDAAFFGSTGAIRLNQPIVGMAATPSGKGYWLVASDGGIFAFGDAAFSGSTGAIRLNRPIVGMAASASGNGYRLVASDGGIFSFGEARFFGSTGSIRLNQPIVGMAATASGDGYWLVASDGGIFSFGDAVFRGSSTRHQPVVGIATYRGETGYWLASAAGAVQAFPTTPGGGAGAAPAGPGTLLPGSGLPNESECAGRVRRSGWEPRPRNWTANHTVPPVVSIPGFTPNQGGVDLRSRAYADRVTGNFTGTTDEIIQWAACKWGLDLDIVRAVAVQESSWDQAVGGDVTNDQARCQVGYTAPCPESFGLLQVKARFHPGTFPWSRDSTAFNLDYALMNRRICYEGWVTYLYRDPRGGYGPGNEWGCVGSHWSGHWMDEGALRYIDRVRAKLDARSWLQPGF